MTTTRSKYIPIATCLALVLAACSSDSSKSADVTTTAAPSPTAETSAATTTPESSAPSTAAPDTSAPATCVEEVDSPDTVVLVHICGAFLTSYGELTLYTFDADTPDSGVSACYDGCAATWPPVVIPEGDFLLSIPDGFDEIPRDDGLGQLTYQGWPLYFYSGDSAPGDVNGDGVGGVWHVVSLV